MRIIFDRAQAAAEKNGGRGEASWTLQSLMGKEVTLLEGSFTRPTDFALRVDERNPGQITITWTPSHPDLEDPRKRVLTGNLRAGNYSLRHVDP